jgi:hypothetical protein
LRFWLKNTDHGSFWQVKVPACPQVWKFAAAGVP